MLELNTIHCMNALDGLKQLPDNYIDCCITSPPYYGLRSYGTNSQVWGDGYVGELGQEEDPKMFINHLMMIFNEVKRVLKPSGTCWVNIADTYATNRTYQVHQSIGSRIHTYSKGSKIPEGLRAKSQIGIPERFVIAMLDCGWIKRNTIIWWKPNAMPFNGKDRFTNDFEPFYFFTKKSDYFFNQQLEPYESKPQKPIDKSKQQCNNGYFTDRFSPGERDYYNQGGRNLRCVWRINTKPYHKAHFATFPPELVNIPIKAGCPKNGIVLDPFMGSGTVAAVTIENDRQFIGFELKFDYIQMANKRIYDTCEKLLKEMESNGQ